MKKKEKMAFGRLNLMRNDLLPKNKSKKRQKKMSIVYKTYKLTSLHPYA